MKKLSIGMIVKNEADVLQATLEALQPLREALSCEVIIADTGSTDETIAIAETFADRFLSIPWEGDFAKARNATLSKATGEWFFYLDADEVLEDPQELINFLKSIASKKYNSILIAIRNLTSVKQQVACTFGSPRIFRRNSQMFFRGRIHEYCNQFPPIYNLQETHLLHYGYNNDDVVKMAAKSKRNAALIEAMLADPLADQPKAKLLLDYADALNISLTVEGAAAAMEQARKAAVLIETLPETLAEKKYFRGRAYSLLLRGYTAKGEHDQCLKDGAVYLTLRQGSGKQDMDIVYCMGFSHQAKGDYQQAIDFYEEYLTLLPLDKTFSAFILGTENLGTNATLSISLCYQALEDNQHAWEYAKPVTEATVGIHNVLLYKFQLAIQQDVAERLPEFYAGLPDEATKMNMLTALGEAFFAAEDARRVEFVETLRQLEQGTTVWQMLACATEDKAEFKQLLDEVPDTVFPGNMGHILDQGLTFGMPLVELLPYLDWHSLDDYLVSCVKYRPDFVEKALDYYRHNQPENLTLAGLHLAQYILCYGAFYTEAELSLSKALLEAFMDYAQAYLEQLYQPDIWQESQLHVFNPIEQFVFYYEQARQAKGAGDYSRYIHDLRAGLSAYPAAQRVVNILLDEIEQELAPVNLAARSEMAELAELVKAQIQGLIAQDQITEAMALLAELAEIVPDDAEIPELSNKIRQLSPVLH